MLRAHYYQQQSGWNMTTASSRPPDLPRQSLKLDFINPFQTSRHRQQQDFSVQLFLKKQIESIFHTSKKIDLQAKIEIYWKTTEQKAFEQTSASTVYSIIRDTVEGITWKLRELVDHSYLILRNNNKSLCKMSPVSASWQKNWIKFKGQSDSPSLKTIYPPLSAAYLFFYKHLCDCAKEVYNLWKIIYECIPVKDLQCESFQQNISELILEIFTTPTKTFEPRHMLPLISFSSKCKFIKADAENNCRRLEYTRFEEDELAQNLIEVNSRRMKSLGLDLEEYQFYQKPQINLGGYQKRLDRSKLDHRFLQELRKQYIQEREIQGNQEQFARAQLIKPDGLVEDKKESFGTVKAELLSTFEENNKIAFENQDTSSQEDDLHAYYASVSSSEEQLIEENQELEVQFVPQLQKIRENEISAKLSESTGIEENNDHQDLVNLKHYEFETPPDFILQEQLNCPDPSQSQQKFTFQFSQRYLAKLDHCLQKQQLVICNRDGHLCSTIEKGKKRISKQHDKYLREHSKCYLEYEKEKLQKYRKELQKEKEELLREVERFVKEKDKDEQLYRMINDKIGLKNSDRKPKQEYKYSQDFKNYDFSRFRSSPAQEDGLTPMIKEELKEYKSKQNNPEIAPKVEEITGVKQQAEGEKLEVPVVNNNEKELEKPVKLSKRQQKKNKKQERQSLQSKEKTDNQSQIGAENQKQPADPVVSEQEAKLTAFLDGLIINSSRANCILDEAKLQLWKNRIPLIRSQVIAKCPLLQVKPKSPEVVPQSSRKKKKNRR